MTDQLSTAEDRLKEEATKVSVASAEIEMLKEELEEAQTRIKTYQTETLDLYKKLWDTQAQLRQLLEAHGTSSTQPLRSERHPSRIHTQDNVQASNSLEVFRHAEVQKHQKQHDLCIIIYNKVYDVSKFLYEHP